VSLLTIGFTSQAAGYVLVVGRDVGAQASAERALGAVAALLSGMVLGWASDRVVQRTRLKPGMIELARYTMESERLELPASNKLRSMTAVRWALLH
jgi:hypothetical protein